MCVCVCQSTKHEPGNKECSSRAWGRGRGRLRGERGNVARHSAIARLLSQLNNERESGTNAGGERVLGFANSLCVAPSLSVCPALPCPALCECVSRYWQLKPLVCFFRCVCVCVRQKHKVQIKNCKNKSKNISSIFLLDFLLRDVFLPAALTNTPTHTHMHSGDK